MLKIKILFKNGHTGYYKLIGEEMTKDELKEFDAMISKIMRDTSKGSIQFVEIKTGYLTRIDIQEIVTFGTSIY